MAAGWDDAPQRTAPGFPDNGKWVVSGGLENAGRKIAKTPDNDKETRQTTWSFQRCRAVFHCPHSNEWGVYF